MKKDEKEQKAGIKELVKSSMRKEGSLSRTDVL